jgi:hypothetical protein
LDRDNPDDFLLSYIGIFDIYMARKDVIFLSKLILSMTDKAPWIFPNSIFNILPKTNKPLDIDNLLIKKWQKIMRYQYIHILFHPLSGKFLELIVKEKTADLSRLIDKFGSHNKCLSLLNDIFDHINNIEVNRHNVEIKKLYRSILNKSIEYNYDIVLSKYFSKDNVMFDLMAHVIKFDNYIKIKDGNFLSLYKDKIKYYNGPLPDGDFNNNDYHGQIIIHISLENIKNFDIYKSYLELLKERNSSPTDIELHVMKIFKHTRQFEILEHIYINYTYLINNEVINNLNDYHFKDIRTLKLFGKYLTSDKIYSILSEYFAEYGIDYDIMIYSFQLLEGIERNDEEFKREISGYIYIFKYMYNDDNYRIMDFLIKIALRENIDIMKKFDNYFQDACFPPRLYIIQCLINNGIKFKYDHVASLYRSLKNDCDDVPSQFKQVVRQMMKNLEPCY